MTMLSRVAAMGVAALLGACAVQPSAKGPPETLMAANAVNVHSALPAPPSRVVAADTQVAQTLALWRAVSRGAVGQEIEWESSASGDHGSAMVLRDVPLPASDRVCREYRQEGVIDNRAHRKIGQACQQRDGSWVVLGGPAAMPTRTISMSSPCTEARPHQGVLSRRDPLCRG